VLGVLGVLVELVVFLLLCFDVFLAVFFAGAVLFWAGADWLGAGVVDCAKVSGRLAAAKTSASKLFFILILLEGLFCPVYSILRQRPFYCDRL
jgi:hypothetical protein